MKTVGNIIKWITVITSIITLVAILILFVLATKFSVITVVSGSMLPALKIGDSVIVKSVKAADCEKGDIVVYNNPDTGINIIHRVVDIRTTVETDSDGANKLKTLLTVKGDANEVADNVEVSDDYKVRKVVIMPSRFLNNFVKVFRNSLTYLVIAILLVVGILLLKTILKGDEQGERGNAVKQQESDNIEEQKGAVSVSENNLVESNAENEIVDSTVDREKTGGGPEANNIENQSKADKNGSGEVDDVKDTMQVAMAYARRQNEVPLKKLWMTYVKDMRETQVELDKARESITEQTDQFIADIERERQERQVGANMEQSVNERAREESCEDVEDNYVEAPKEHGKGSMKACLQNKRAIKKLCLTSIAAGLIVAVIKWTRK